MLMIILAGLASFDHRPVNSDAGTPGRKPHDESFSCYCFRRAAQAAKTAS